MRTLALTLALLAPAAQAARVESVTSSHSHGVFSVSAQLSVDAPLASVHAVIIDFANLSRLSPAILESRQVGMTARGPLVFTRTRSCVAWFCRELRKVELVEIGPNLIVVTADPKQSNVTSFVARWTLVGHGRRTSVTWEATFDPAFFVPPLIGPPLIKGALKREGEALAAGIERAAQARGG